ncbi:transcription factor MYB25-like [Phragmites australis]|uniref:transcription factor MYB25-like n=1 Tax=Phragmites australis TaxID=29695 RepID=UPI002D77C752|nr:transcription factor MYB25-like [Phragmites australis]
MAVPDEAPGGRGGTGAVAERPVMRKSAWSKDEDAVLREQVRLHGAQNWVSISAGLPGRNAKSCRLRWCQHLAPGVDDAKPFTPQEDRAIIELQLLHPNKWSTIAGFLPGRTDNSVKNRWNSVLRKQQPQAAPASREDGTLLPFPLTPGDVRKRGRDSPVLHYCPPEETGDTGINQSGACLELFPLAPGDLIKGNSASDVAAMDVDYGAGDPLTELRLWPSTTTTMAAFKAMVQAVRAP